jgi:hypothetical protein
VDKGLAMRQNLEAAPIDPQNRRVIMPFPTER